ncbi:MAG: alpha/beta fold hydrolase, partial [Pseudomonadota bacterium]
MSRIRTLRNSRRMRTVLAICLAAVVLIGVVVLEKRFSDLEIDIIRVDGTPVTLYRLQGSEPRPAVIVAHGFGGSRQMMDQIAVSLARNGFMVASVDLPGHGRNDQRLSPDITQLSGTTSQLVHVVEHAAQSVATRPEVYGPMSYVGHSMASDIVIRASASRNDVGGVVAVSMYSPAVTDTQPASLLVLSGARETRLRAAALDAVRLVDPQAVEG